MKSLFQNQFFLFQITSISLLYIYGILIYFVDELEIINYNFSLYSISIFSFFCLYKLRKKLRIIPIFIFQTIMVMQIMNHHFHFFWIKAFLHLFILILFLLNLFILYIFPPYHELPTVNGKKKKN